MEAPIWLQRLLGPRTGEPILREVAEGGAHFRTVVLTRNRRVMVSVGDGGKTLRLHECFAEAPPEVLRAVGCLLAPSRGGERRLARETVRGFLRARTLREPRPRRRPGRGDADQIERLQAEFDRVNQDHFAGALPRVPLALSGRMRRRNGHFSSVPLEIVLSRTLCARASAGEAEKTLRHEMIHLWQFHEGRKPGHGADFRRWAERLGIHPRATRTVEWNC